MGIFKLRDNKKFSYTPRHFNDKGEGNPYKMVHRFDDFRSTVETPKGIKSRLNAAIADFKNPDRETNRRVLIIILILLLIALFVIDFDLTIFFPA